MAQFFLADQAPTTATWQSLYNLYWTVAITAGVITVGALVYFAVRYRSKPGVQQEIPQEGQKGSLRSVLIVVVIMALVLGGAAFASFKTIAFYDRPPANALHINVVGFRFGWNFQYSDGQEVPGQVVVPENTPVVLNITSLDVFHSLGIPALKVKADAIPGKANTLWFQAPAGIYRIQCFELCGNGHAFMIAKLNVCQGACA
jgi:cytochrome c oxidase subunit 2